MNGLTSIRTEGKMVCVFGPPDSGKSNLAKYVFSRKEYRRHMIYDPLYGWDPEKYNLIRPPSRASRYRRYEAAGNDELNKAVDNYILDSPPGGRPKYFAIDEAARLLPNGKDPGGAMLDLLDFNAHYNVSVWFLAQRPAQLNTDAENKSAYYFVLGFQGKNDRDALKSIHADLPARLEAAKREFGAFAGVVVGPNNSIAPFRPVPEMGAKGMM